MTTPPRVNVYLPAELAKEATDHAAALGLSLSAWVRMLIIKELKENKSRREDWDIPDSRGPNPSFPK